jgi:hypothetical protein
MKQETKYLTLTLIAMVMVTAFLLIVGIDPGNSYRVVLVEHPQESHYDHYEVAHCHFLLPCYRWGTQYSFDEKGLASARQTVERLNEANKQIPEKVTIIK